MISGILVLVSLEMFNGVIKGSADSVPVLIVPVEGGYQLQIAGSVLATARGQVRVFVTLDAILRFCNKSMRVQAGRAFSLQVRVDGEQLF